MAINLGDKPLAGFGQPIEMLQDCHRRIEHFLDVLCKVESRFGAGELTDEARRALRTSLDYFTTSAPNHTADEEQSLFPRMRCSDDPAALAVMEDLSRLEHDHKHCDAAHAVVDQIGRQWLETGRLAAAERARMRAALDELSLAYAAHIPLEETHVFPVAAQVLQADQLRQVGNEMQARRAIARASD